MIISYYHKGSAVLLFSFTSSRCSLSPSLPLSLSLSSFLSFSLIFLIHPMNTLRSPFEWIADSGHNRTLPRFDTSRQFYRLPSFLAWLAFRVSRKRTEWRRSSISTNDTGNGWIYFMVFFHFVLEAWVGFRRSQEVPQMCGSRTQATYFGLRWLRRCRRCLVIRTIQWCTNLFSIVQRFVIRNLISRAVLRRRRLENSVRNFVKSQNYYNYENHTSTMRIYDSESVSVGLLRKEWLPELSDKRRVRF